jgi:hypothetical protein
MKVDDPRYAPDLSPLVPVRPKLSHLVVQPHYVPWNYVMVRRRLSDDDLLALVLINTWTLVTGRMLRSDVPPRELSEEELIDFWADDHDPFRWGSTLVAGQRGSKGAFAAKPRDGGRGFPEQREG